MSILRNSNEHMIAISPETREGMRNCRTKVNTPNTFLAAPDHSSVHSSNPSSSVHCNHIIIIIIIMCPGPLHVIIY